MSFLLKTAYRDGRRQSRRLLLCAASIMFGVAALAAVDSFAVNLEDALEREAKTLLGADLQITSRRAFTEPVEDFFARLGGEQAREIRFASMAYFPEAEQSRLVQLRAISGGFPFYGRFETEPPGANPARIDRPVVVLDPLLMNQYGLSIGDLVRLGEADFEVIASLISVPGEAAFAGVFAPRAYIPLSQLEATGLIGTGSIAFHRLYAAQFPEPAEAVVTAHEGFWAEHYLEATTVADKQSEVGRPLENLSRFLGLVGFIALLLGGVGIAGAAQSYLREKRDTVAILRCLGCDSGRATRIFLLQIMAVAVVGSAAGVVLSLFCQAALPLLLAPLLPFELAFALSPGSLIAGFCFGSGTAFVFGLFPLLPLRRVSPLRALRASYEEEGPSDRLAVRLLAGVTTLLLVLFCMSRTEAWWQGGLFALGLGLVLLILWGMAAGLQCLLRKGFQPRNYLLRQASANLHRPNNRTVFLIVSLGMGSCLIYTLVLVQTGLLQQTAIAAQSDDPNVLFFDVQPDQREGLHRTLESYDMAVLEEAPVVTMRLAAVKGRAVSALKSDPANAIDEWILNREWRSSYRAAPGPSARVVEGDYVSQWDSMEAPVPISLEEEMARELGVSVGDSLRFDIQGIPMEVVVGNLRRVDWTELRPNFFATFPLGVLEAAPQWWIAVTRSPDSATTARLQSDLFAEFPNISAVDLNVILNALESVLGRINFAIQFMGLFTVATGVIILLNVLATSRRSRVQESVILRTLGARASQIRWIMALEYGIIGAVAGVLGIGLALCAASALGIWVFQVEFHLPWLQILAAIGSVVGLAVVIGLAGSRGIATHPPLAVLRREV
jgi:putative ABC transport system permease protein